MVDNVARKTVVHRGWLVGAPVIDRGEDIYLYDQDGNRYIGGGSGSSVVMNIGHGAQSVVEAM